MRSASAAASEAARYSRRSSSASRSRCSQSIAFDMSPTLAVAVGTAAGMTAMTRLILASLIIAALLVGTAGVEAIPVAALAAVAAWLTMAAIDARFPAASESDVAMVTIDDVRSVASTLPRSYEAFVQGRVKFRVGRIVYLAFSRDETLLGFAFPKEWRDALIENEPEKFMLPRDVRPPLQLGGRPAGGPRRGRAARARRRCLGDGRAQERRRRVRRAGVSQESVGDPARDLPDVAVGIGECRGAHAPVAVDRAVQELDAARPQLRADRVRVVDPDRQLEARAALRRGDRAPARSARAPRESRAG